MASATQTPLSTLIISPSDLRRARREVESVDEIMHQANLRTKAAPAAGKSVVPQTSRLIDELASETGANLLRSIDRAALISYLSDLIDHAPVLHFSFASEPSGAFMTKLIVWLRANIHPQVLVHLGLQPSIAAGCVVRTSNRQFDFSLNAAFEAQHEMLVNSLTEVMSESQPSPAAPAETSTVIPVAVKPKAAA